MQHLQSRRAAVAADAAAAIGEGLPSFCIPGSVADTRKVGLGHGNLGKMLLEEETECFAVSLAGHESFGQQLRCHRYRREGKQGSPEASSRYLKRLGKDAAQIISPYQRISIYVETEYNPYNNEVKEVIPQVIF